MVVLCDLTSSPQWTSVWNIGNTFKDLFLALPTVRPLENCNPMKVDLRVAQTLQE